MTILLWTNVAFSQSFYVGAHYHFPFNPIDPFAENSRIQQQYYADGVAEDATLDPYNISGLGAMLGYSGLFYKEFSVEWRISDYNFKPKENSSGRNVIEQALLIRARAPQIRIRGSIFGSFYASGGLGRMKNNGNIKYNRPTDYKSQNFIAGFEFYKKLSRFSYTPHRFFIEIIDMTAESDPYEQTAARGGSVVKRAEILNSRHILIGYSFDIF
ncbi:MAG: hypothetical protein K0U45_05475 [Alphaproteobacteria bacterium]|nr:hypothetical protein [Alphaproteobacteria bacterium]